MRFSLDDGLLLTQCRTFTLGSSSHRSEGHVAVAKGNLSHRAGWTCLRQAIQVQGSERGQLSQGLQRRRRQGDALSEAQACELWQPCIQCNTISETGRRWVTRRVSQFLSVPPLMSCSEKRSS